MCHGGAIAAWASRTWAFDSANFLPPLRPRALAALNPARVRVSDHRLWETAVLFPLRDAFRAGDVWAGAVAPPAVRGCRPQPSGPGQSARLARRAQSSHWTKVCTGWPRAGPRST